MFGNIITLNNTHIVVFVFRPYLLPVARQQARQLSFKFVYRCEYRRAVSSVPRLVNTKLLNSLPLGLRRLDFADVKYFGFTPINNSV